MKSFFKTSEVAKMCHVTTGSVIRWVREGKLAASVTAGGHNRVPAEEVVKLLKFLRMPAPPELKSSGGVRRPPAKVLIVDDELGMRQLIRSVIEENFPAVQIEEAPEGFIAGWKTHSFCPDLVILDLLLPGIDGFRVCQLIRSFPESARMRILAITGMAESDVEQKILKLGADDFLAKPLDLDALKEKIAKHLQVADTVQLKHG